MSYPVQHYTIIDEFFDTYSLPLAHTSLSRLIKTANQEKIWKGRSPADVVFFIEKLQGLVSAVFNLLENNNRPEEILLPPHNNDAAWNLTAYPSYCGWQRALTPWHFFPRYLSQKEFGNPFLALEKFTRYRSLTQWQQLFKDLAFYALSPSCMDDLEDGTSLLGTWVHLHKLLDATHLIEVRRNSHQEKNPKKWKGLKEAGTNNQEQSTIKEASLRRIEEFFHFFGEDGAQEELWEMTKRSLTNENDKTEATERSNIIFLYGKLKQLVEDIHCLHP